MTAPILGAEISAEKLKSLNMQSLSFIGDAVQTLYTRTEIVFTTSASGGRMHALTSNVVKATNQAKKVDLLFPLMSVEEQEIFKKGRNAFTKSMAKNSTANEYHKASGLEALIGYLYVVGRTERLTEILSYVYAE